MTKASFVSPKPIDSPDAPEDSRLPGDLQREDETLEPLLYTGGHILQKRSGYRFSIDALLLAGFAATRLAPGVRSQAGRYMDLGTGCGVIAVLLANRRPDLTGYAVEIQEPLADVAARNMLLHGLQDQVQVLHMDMKALPDRFSAASFDWITSNPPYRRMNSGRVNPDPEKALSRHELSVSLNGICKVMAYLLKPKGRAFLVYPADRTTGLLACLRQNRLEPKVLRPVYPKPGEGARRILVEALAGGGEEMLFERPLVVEDLQGEYTEEVSRLFAWRF